jgi:hypothetical protein
MRPEDKEKYELDTGKVLTKEDEDDILLLVNGLVMLRKHHDFLRNIPWARSDN